MCSLSAHEGKSIHVKPGTYSFVRYLLEQGDRQNL